MIIDKLNDGIYEIQISSGVRLEQVQRTIDQFFEQNELPHAPLFVPAGFGSIIHIREISEETMQALQHTLNTAFPQETSAET